MQQQSMVQKRVLSNGLTILVRTTKTVPKVSVQLFYNVGSKDEKTGQKGIAHLIEHMIFKGTRTLSESDINLITHKLSGYCNAFTSYDYTGYLFDFPTQHWHHALPIMADCMRNCTFKQELLNSEMKAVIQELKMYKDNHTSTLFEHLVSAIFDSHPYHYPIIGFKQDLWSVSRQTLLDFYEQHYIPNNATLVVVGDVDPGDVFLKAEQHFGHIKPDWSYSKQTFFVTDDIQKKSVQLYRDIQQPHVMFAFKVPGAKSKQDFQIDLLSWIVGAGKASRLYKKLVDDHALATYVDVMPDLLFDQGLLFLYIQPIEQQSMPAITDIVTQEIEQLAQDGIQAVELQRSIKQTESSFLSLLESNQKQAYFIGKSYLATGDHNYLFSYCTYDNATIEQQLQDLLQHYCRPSLMHAGAVLPLAQQDRQLWQQLQDESDQLDAKILAKAVRTVAVEEGVHVHTIQKEQPKAFAFPKPKRFVLDNGLTVLSHNNAGSAKIELLLSLKAKYYYDPANLEGLYSCLTAMLLEGTKKYSKQELAQAFENRGMSVSIKPGMLSLSCLKADLPIALHLLAQLVFHANFTQVSLEKVKKRMLSDVAHFWDEPTEFIKYLAKKQIYQQHPYAKLQMGTKQTIERIALDDVVAAYEQWFCPQDAILAIVGDIQDYDLPSLVDDNLGTWKTVSIPHMVYPPLEVTKPQMVHHPINRDQIVLAFAGKSIARKDPVFDKVMLFDQIFTGGPLGAMSSRLFALREQSGLFYTIGGSLLYDADHQPGMIYIRTIVSADRLQEAQQAIANTIDQSLHISDQEFMQAQDALINSMVDNFETNKGIAYAFLFLERLKLPFDYFDHRIDTISNIGKEQVLQAVAPLLSTKQLAIIKVGRL